MAEGSPWQPGNVWTDKTPTVIHHVHTALATNPKSATNPKASPNPDPKVANPDFSNSNLRPNVTFL